MDKIRNLDIFPKLLNEFNKKTKYGGFCIDIY